MSSSVQNELEKISSWCGDLYQYEGFWNHENRVKGIMAAQENFEAKPTDIFLASHVKTGTTWLKALAFAIATRTTFPTSPLLTKIPHDCIPNLEKELTQKSSTNRDSEIPLVSTHISYTSLPKSIIESGCKIVYIWRDVKDAFVSYWFFFNKIRESIHASGPPPQIEEAFEQFCQGVSLYGPYWDHVLGYWKAKLEFPEKILFLKYEEMKEDTVFYVKQLAEFMGYPFSLEEEENGVVEKIVSMCSFDGLSSLEVNKTGKYRPPDSINTVLNNNIFFRKGQIGDWKNVLTPEMGARLDSIMDKKLNALGLLESSSQNNFESKNVLTPEMGACLDSVMGGKLNASSLLESSSQNKTESKNVLAPEMEVPLDAVMDSKSNASRLLKSSSQNNVLTPEMEARLDSVMGNKLNESSLLKSSSQNQFESFSGE